MTDDIEQVEIKTKAARLHKSDIARSKRKETKETVITRTENEYAKARRERKNK